jgi:hypothetical protein
MKVAASDTADSPIPAQALLFKSYSQARSGLERSHTVASLEQPSFSGNQLLSVESSREALPDRRKTAMMMRLVWQGKDRIEPGE